MTAAKSPKSEAAQMGSIISAGAAEPAAARRAITVVGISCMEEVFTAASIRMGADG